MTKFVIIINVPADEPEYAYDWLSGQMRDVRTASLEDEAQEPIRYQIMEVKA